MIESILSDSDFFDSDASLSKINWMGWKIKHLSSTEVTVSITWEFLKTIPSPIKRMQLSRIL